MSFHELLTQISEQEPTATKQLEDRILDIVKGMGTPTAREVVQYMYYCTKQVERSLISLPIAAYLNAIFSKKRLFTTYQTFHDWHLCSNTYFQPRGLEKMGIVDDGLVIVSTSIKLDLHPSSYIQNRTRGIEDFNTTISNIVADFLQRPLLKGNDLLVALPMPAIKLH